MFVSQSLAAVLVSVIHFVFVILVVSGVGLLCVWR